MAYKIDEDALVHCLECGDAITYGRPDKKFCCESCKNRWHNRLEKASRSYRVKVKATLSRNYEVLNDLLKLGISRMNLYDLRALGYDPQYVTAAIPVGKRFEYMCYDIRFRQTPVQVSNLTKIAVPRRKTGENDVTLPSVKMKNKNHG
ncbi:MAG: DUF2116 family Zn-ribbon domain-containing protein [Bacteroidales bacterium]|nr:DUF2116 family Zn-ribbon domain-containing protein [Bacteroidales bacterium]